MNTGLTNLRAWVVAVSGVDTWVGTYGGGIFRSTNSGVNWIERTSGLGNGSGLWVHAIAFSSSATVYAGTDSGFFRTNNFGADWLLFNNGLTDRRIRAIVATGSNVIVGTADSGVFFSTNSGFTWNPANTGLTNLRITSLAIIGTDLFAGTYANGMWRRPLSEIVTSVEDRHEGLPERITLHQNYPNPFSATGGSASGGNPSTNIKYQIPSSNHVTLKVFDVLGREVATLVNEVKQPGSYEVTFDAGGLPSGVYFYRLQAGEFVQARKLLLLR